MNPYAWFELLDYARRAQGEAMDHLGLAPRESHFQLVLERPCFRLRRYSIGAAGRPALLIVPAPIKRPYIWDLFPERSVVRHAMARKLGVFLVEWTEPDERSSPGLEDYSGPMLDHCLAEISSQTGNDKACLMGHSLGGVFAALYSAYRPGKIAGLALFETPLHFPKTAGPFGMLLKWKATSTGQPPLPARVPGSFLSIVSANAEPAVFYANRYLDYMGSIASPERMATHMRVERWTLDELPMSRPLLDDVVERLYREDSFMRGEFRIGGVPIHPRDITAPLVTVYRPSSTVAPREALIAFDQATGSTDKEMIPYSGDVGVALQHVGALVGDNAYRQVWPRMFKWMDRVTLRPS